jgi:hypothetical protein
MNDELTLDERTLIRAALRRYEADIRKACEEDQGHPDGKPGTLGNEIQARIRELTTGKLRSW